MLKIKPFSQYSKIISIAFWAIVLIDVALELGCSLKSAISSVSFFRVLESLTLGTIKIAKIRGAHYFLTFNLAGTAYTTVILFLLQQQPQLEE